MTTTIRRSLAAGAVLVATLTAGGCGGSDKPASQSDEPIVTTSGSGPGATQTLRLESQLSPSARRQSNVPGTQMVFTGMLFRPKGKSAIGRSQGACTRTAPGRGEVYQCTLSFVLRGGTIYGQAMSSADGPAEGVVTGGVGHYRDADGTFAFKATGTPRVRLTFTLGGGS
jgi:hypothetical protein